MHTTQDKPLAFNEAIFKGKLPVKGDHVSVEANEGKYWCFGEHRTMVITRNQPFYKPPDLDTGFYQRLSQPILEMLRTTGQVSSDDVHDEIMSLVGVEHSPKVIGWVFGWLARKKRIH